MVPSSFMISTMTAAGSQPAIRARSQPASVWPARCSTPPGCAINGNTWPGITISFGLASRATATCTVFARSAAEMPVVTPSAASIEQVKLVPSWVPLRPTINGNSSCSQRSWVSVRQIRPRACLAMKLTASGVTNSAAITRSPSFSRSSSSIRITILPARRSSISSRTLLSFMCSPDNSFFCRSLIACEASTCIFCRLLKRHCFLAFQEAVFGEKRHADASAAFCLGGLVAEQQALQVTGNHIHFQVDLAARPPFANGGHVLRVRHDIETEHGTVNTVYRQADAVDGDRALVRNIFCQRCRRLDVDARRTRIRCQRTHRANAVDMAGHEMAAESRGWRQRLFQVYR